MTPLRKGADVMRKCALDMMEFLAANHHEPSISRRAYGIPLHNAMQNAKDLLATARLFEFRAEIEIREEAKKALKAARALIKPR